MATTRGTWLATIVFGTVLALAVSLQAATSDLPRTAAELAARYAADLESLAKWCESNGLKDEAAKTRRLVTPTDPYKLYVPVLPTEIGAAKPPADASEKQVEWDLKLSKLRREQAADRFDAARRAIRANQAGLAFDLALGALLADPDYEPARRLFGYQKFRNQWHTPYEIRKLRANYVWSDRFGWLPKAHLRRYEDGERYRDGRWISAEDDAKRHANIRSGWEIETEHYTIRTNHSIEAGVALGIKLERLNRLWQQLFVRYFASQADVVGLFDGRAAKQAAAGQRRHEVWYFRNRDEYNRALKPTMPNIGISIGVYVEGSRRAYFFAGDEGDERTLYHEATHQLFHESRPVVPGVARKGNFWIIEGIAMFMESLRQEDGYYVLGGFQDQRLHAAKYRLMHDHYYVPLGEFVDIGIERLQQETNEIGRRYTQSAGLTHFLVFFDGGRYRDALVAYLVAVYSGRDTHNTLAQLTGAASYEELDKQYRKFIEEGI
jgi:hypothetical protein